jgi:hypothetical protein
MVERVKLKRVKLKPERRPLRNNGGSPASKELALEAEEAEPVKRKGRGRPSKYKPEYATEALELCKEGVGDRALAKHFDVTLTTIGAWKAQYKDFADALQFGKAPADYAVQVSMFEMATGYDYEEDQAQIVTLKRAVRDKDGNPVMKTTEKRDGTKVTEPTFEQVIEKVVIKVQRHEPANPVAASFWLINRDSENWSKGAKSQVELRAGIGLISEERAAQLFAQGLLGVPEPLRTPPLLELTRSDSES